MSETEPQHVAGVNGIGADEQTKDSTTAQQEPNPSPSTQPIDSASTAAAPSSNGGGAPLSPSATPPASASPSSAAAAPPASTSPSRDGADGGEEPAAKRQRKRKSLWDQSNTGASTPAGSSGGSFSSSPFSSSGFLPLGSALSPSSSGVNPMFAQMQAQLAMLPHLSSSHALSSPSTASRLDRRIYVGSLAYDIAEETIRVIFEPFGPVAKVDMPKEPGQLPVRSKGFCFVEFERPDSAKAALMTMNGVHLRGRPMKVGKPTGGANSEYGSFLSQLMAGGAQGMATALQGQQLNTTALAALQAAQIASGGSFNPSVLSSLTSPAGGGERGPGMPNKTRIYVGSLMWELTEEQVRAIFEPFGTVRSCQLIMSPETGRHRGYGFVEYTDEKSAADAIAAMDGFELIGRKLKVNYASALNAPQLAHQASAPQLPPQLPPGFTVPTLPPSMLGSAFASSFAASAAPTSLHAEDNMRIHSHEQRASIMQKLSDSGRQSCVLLLKNLLTAEEIDPELEGEVAEECGKYGQVRQVKVVPDHRSGVVRVYVVFAAVSECGKAVEGLNGRFFGGRTVSAEFYPQLKFDAGVYTDT